MLTCGRRWLKISWRVFETRCQYRKHAPSIRRNTFKYLAKLATRTRAINAGCELNFTVLDFHCTFIALWRYHVRFCVVNLWRYLLRVLWRVLEARCHYHKHAPSIRKKTFKYFAQLATRARAINAGRELHITVLDFHCTFIALWRYHVRFCVVNMMYLLYCSIMVFVSFFFFLVINTRTTWLPQFRRTPSLNTPIPLWITTTPCTVALTRRSVISQLQSDISATFLHRCLNTLCCYF